MAVDGRNTSIPWPGLGSAVSLLLFALILLTMPPRAPAQDQHSSAVEDDAMQSSMELKSPQKSPIPASSNTFHWELNLYSFGLLAGVYYFADEYRVLMQIVFALIALDITRYYYYKGSMAGVPYTLPMVSLTAMIIRPVRFWTEMASIAMKSADGICTNILAGNFMVFVTDPKLCREIMTGEGTFGVYAHPNALWLFGPKNLIYLETERHKTFRGILTPALFSREALEQYAEAQERVVRDYMSRYSQMCADGQSIDLQVYFRSMAAASSQESFLGPYLKQGDREHLERDILAFTMGFLCFPFPYLNSGLHRAIQAKNRIEKTIRDIVPKARAYIEAGNAPRCMMDHWSLAIIDAAKERGVDPQDLDCCTDDDMARTVLDFLFAAQDATNSALTYSLDVLDAHRDVLERMRAEVAKVCGNGQVWTKKDDLEYTAKVANQLLHHKPPVPMIPHLSKMATTIGGHDIPKGTVCIPSITYSARMSGASTEFLPEREDQDHLFVKCVTFGAGQHKCPGRRYAESLLGVFLAVVAAEYDFQRTGPRPTADEFIYFPTVFPRDSNFVIHPKADAAKE